MPFDDSNPAPGPDKPPEEPSESPGEAPGESLIVEIRSAADAAVSRVRKVAATASTEARISVASVIAMAMTALFGLLLLIVAWICLVGLGAWLAIDAGWSNVAVLLTAASANLLAAILCRIWFGRLLRNIGFPRTLSLLFGQAERRHEHPR